MNIGNAIVVGLKEMWANKFRSVLTILGIVLGVSSLVAMSALVKGMENGMREALVAVGGVEKVRVEQEDLPPEQVHLEDEAVGVTMHDVYALQGSAPLITMISPEMSGGRFLRVGREGKEMERAFVSGTWPNALEMNEHVIEHGRMFNEIDGENAWNVCVIGTRVRDELFGSPAELGREVVPLGEHILIGGLPFRIIGMFEHYESERDRKQRELMTNAPPGLARGGGVNRSRGWSGGSFVFTRKNSTIYIPLNTMWIKFRSGGTSTNSIPDPSLSALNIRVANVELIEPALQQARNVLMHTHRGIRDFEFETQESWSENIATAIQNMRRSRGYISAISLLVGGIGIMNIMLASITERVREIGIRKAVGASGVDIFAQILIESLVLALLGGVAGIAASFGLVELIAMLSPTENEPVVTTGSLVLAFGFSAGVGLVAGIAPAWKAARMNPIEALRYE